MTIARDRTGEIGQKGINAIMTIEFRCIRIENDVVFARFSHSNTIILETVDRMQVKEEHQARSLKDKNLIILVFSTNPRLNEIAYLFRR